jgi:predicted transcriptional regulator YheO
MRKKKEYKIDRSALIEILKLVVDGIAGTFGKSCEVILHDLRDVRHSIVKIANSNVTGRKEGGSFTDFGIKLLNPKIKDNLFLNYATSTQTGRKLKSSTIMFRDETGRPIATICINVDLSNVINYNQTIQEFFQVQEEPVNGHKIETFENDVSQALNEMVQLALNKLSKPLPQINRDERLRIVEELESQGFFLIKGSVKYLAERLDVSKFTIYSYLEKARSKKDKLKNFLHNNLNWEK